MDPRMILHYRIIKKIGEGGMGEVYLAEDTNLKRKVALKLLRKEFTENQDRLRRFKQEAETASALTHPNIITIFEMGQADTGYYIVTEFIEGETLRQRLLQGSMTINQSLHVAIEVAKALTEAHEAGILHRDIKPENIMLRKSDHVKVLDFGLAKIFKQQAIATDSKALTPLKEAITNPEDVLGTPHYMSPEQALNKPIDARSDIFSLGVVLYEMIAGCTPFAGETRNELLINLVTKEPLPMTRFAPDAPAEIHQIISKTLHKNIDERYQTIKSLLNDLETLKRKIEFEEEFERSGSPEANSKAKDKTIETANWVETPGETEKNKDAGNLHFASDITSYFSWIKNRKRLVALSVLLVAAVAAFFYFNRRPEPLPAPVLSEDISCKEEAKTPFKNGKEKADNGDNKGAIEDLKRAIEKDKDCVYAHVALAAQYGNTYQWGLAAESAKDAYNLIHIHKVPITEAEKLRTEYFYHEFYTGNVDKKFHVLTQWEEKFSEDFRAPCNFSHSLLRIGEFQKAIDKADACLKMNGKAPSAYATKGLALMRLGRKEDAETVFQDALKKVSDKPEGVDSLDTNTGRYLIAFMRNDGEVLEKEAQLMKNKKNNYALEDLEADKEAFAGNIQESHRHARNSIAFVNKKVVEGVTSNYLAKMALRSAVSKDCRNVENDLKDPGRDPRNYLWLTQTALALALCGKATDADSFITSLQGEDFQENTLVQELWLPVINMAKELAKSRDKNANNRWALEQAVKYSLTDKKYELAAEFWPQYVRGLAYLRLSEMAAAGERNEYGRQAIQEFDKILNNQWQAPLSLLYRLAGEEKKKAIKLIDNSR